MDIKLGNSIMERCDSIIQDMRDCCSSCDKVTEKYKREQWDVMIETMCQMEATMYNMCNDTSIDTSVFAKTIGKK